MAKKKKFVPDTSVLVAGEVSKLVKKGEIEGEIVILEAVLSELENQANKKKPVGFEGLEELADLKELKDEGKIELTFYGEHPSPEEIKAARYGAIDALIRDTATKLNATLITGDYVQYLTARPRDIDCKFIEVKSEERPKIRDYFDSETMSVHLKAGVEPTAKKGTPGNVKLEKISDEKIEEEEIKGLIRGIIDYGRENKSIEINRKGATVVQMDDIRVAIAEPPFSNSIEITAVRPVADVSLEDYKLSDKLMNRLKERAEGVFICGPPGAGKSSFAGALAEFYEEEKDAIIKTMESPRDLQVSDEITQYGPLENSMTKTADVLLLVRPDFTFYDEVRKTDDFEIFADMRLAGVGMVGVTHSSSPMDALQRIVNRMELGQIPLIVDTVIFVKDAEIKKVYKTKMSVKVPVGMTEADLARPVVEVMDFETGEPEYEVYTYGEQTVIMPTKGEPQSVLAEVTKDKSEYILDFGDRAKDKDVKVYAGKKFLFDGRVGKDGKIGIRKNSKMGKKIRRAQKYNDTIKGVIG